MILRLFVSALLLGQVGPESSTRGPGDRLQTVLELASKEADPDGAGLVLSSLLVDEATMRSVISTAAVSNERSVYILFGGNWGRRATVPRDKAAEWSRAMVESVTAKPPLIHSVIRADVHHAQMSQGVRKRVPILFRLPLRRRFG
jgi:hypothetical protein